MLCSPGGGGVQMFMLCSPGGGGGFKCQYCVEVCVQAKLANINSLYSLQDLQSPANVTGGHFTKDTGKATDVYETRTEC